MSRALYEVSLGFFCSKVTVNAPQLTAQFSWYIDDAVQDCSAGATVSPSVQVLSTNGQEGTYTRLIVAD